MSSKSRILQNVFGLTSGSTETGTIGSDSAGSPAYTKDVSVMQSLSQYSLGLFAITGNAAEPPRIQDFNSLFYMLTFQLSYIFQSGIPEWISTENYYANKSIVQRSGSVYIAYTGSEGSPNINNDPLTTSAPATTINWVKMVDVSGALLNRNLTGEITGLTAKPSLASNDAFLIEDSAASNAKKQILWSTLLNNILKTQPNLIENLIVTNTATSITVNAGAIIMANGVPYAFSSNTTPSLSTINGYLSGGGVAWCAICVNESTGAMSVQVLGAGTSGIAASSTLGIAIGTTKDTENQLNMYSCYDNTYGYCRKQINSTGAFYRIFAVFKLTVGFTDSSASTIGTTQPTGYAINVTSTAKYSIGQQISETGSTHIPTNSEIVEITSATQMRMNNIAAGTGSGISVIVANSITNLISIPYCPPTVVKLFNHVIDSYLTNLTPQVVNFNVINIDLNSEISGAANARLFTSLRTLTNDYIFRSEITANSAFGADFTIKKNGNLVENRKIGVGTYVSLPISIISFLDFKPTETLQIIAYPDSGVQLYLNNYAYPQGTAFLIITRGVAL